MTQKRKQSLAKVTIGGIPGTLTSHPNAHPTSLHATHILPDQAVEYPGITLAELEKLSKKSGFLWLNITGLQDIETLESLGKTFGLHLLALEDVVNIPQRPKLEEYPGNLFAILRMERLTGETLTSIEGEQVSFFITKKIIITLQEKPGDAFDPVRKRLHRTGKVRIRTAGTDYLSYALMDAIIDGYYPVLEAYGDTLDDMEETILKAEPTDAQAAQIMGLRRDLLSLRRAIWPLKEVASSLSRDELPLISEDVRAYFRDCHDHVIQVLDLLEIYRERAAGLMDLHLSAISNRMNEIMKVLTLIATIFIPLSFIVGLYGMNFDTSSPYNLPELSYKYGYIVLWIVMLAIVIGFITFFKRKKWL